MIKNINIAIFLILTSGFLLFVRPVLAYAPKTNIQTNLCGVPSYVNYNQKFKINKISFKQFSDSKFKEKDTTYFKMQDKKLPNKRYVKSAVRCFFFTMHNNGFTNLFDKPLQINLVDTSAINTKINYPLWGITIDNPKNYSIYLFRSSIYNNKKNITYIVFHELGHVLNAHFINKEEMNTYKKIRHLDNGYSEKAIERDHNTDELFANDVVKAFIPNKIYPNFPAGTLKNKQDIQKFKEFLFRAINN